MFPLCSKSGKEKLALFCPQVSNCLKPDRDGEKPCLVLVRSGPGSVLCVHSWGEALLRHL